MALRMQGRLPQDILVCGQPEKVWSLGVGYQLYADD